jgi:hypothetical protein
MMLRCIADKGSRVKPARREPVPAMAAEIVPLQSSQEADWMLGHNFGVRVRVEMIAGKTMVEEDARARAAQTLADGKPIMDRALLLRCVDEIEHLKAALRDIADHGQGKGGIWARQRARDALERKG